MTYIILMLSLIILLIVTVETLSNRKYLNTKQYRFYWVLIFFLLIVFCGILENYCNTSNTY